ncbi:MAG: cation transporter [Gemmatimonadetes bacterium]|nr:cation transporter [Gemmatimonadota bacterium]
MSADHDRRALRLSWFTVGYNVLEGVASMLAGGAAGSAALVGFGLDSAVESVSGAVMIWRFRTTRPHADAERAEHRAIRLVGWTFFVLGAYVLVDSAWKLWSGDRPQASVLGIAITIASLVVMPALYVAKQRTARRIGSRSLAADSRQTLACMGMSAGVLLGLLLNRAFGLWQADPAVGILIALLLFREGRQTLREGTLCSC